MQDVWKDDCNIPLWIHYHGFPIKASGIIKARGLVINVKYFKEYFVSSGQNMTTFTHMPIRNLKLLQPEQ